MPPDRRRGLRGGAADSRHGVTFDEFFGGVYGARWPALRKALTATAPKKVVLWNRFCRVPFEKAMANMKRVNDKSFLQVLYCSDDCEVAPLSSVTDEFSVKAHYFLDYTSALVVEQLEAGAFDRVLDMCASTGGKSIAIAQFLSHDATLTANEQRSDRRVRLCRNIREYVPSNYVPVTITQRDAATWYDPSMYHRVLVDAPCTAERHLLQQSGGGLVSAKNWTKQTTLAMSRTQRALLLRALETCRPGGRVVYSTCSISPVENDGVVEEVLKRTRCHVEVQSSSLCDIGEKTRYGNIVLPDTAGGWGPMYCCVIHKVSDRREGSDDDDDDDDEDDDD